MTIEEAIRQELERALSAQECSNTRLLEKNPPVWIIPESESDADVRRRPVSDLWPRARISPAAEAEIARVEAERVAREAIHLAALCGG